MPKSRRRRKIKKQTETARLTCVKKDKEIPTENKRSAGRSCFTTLLDLPNRLRYRTPDLELQKIDTDRTENFVDENIDDRNVPTGDFHTNTKTVNGDFHKKENGRKKAGRKQKDVFEAYCDLSKPRQGLDTTQDSAITSFRYTSPLVSSALIEMFNNEPTIQKKYRQNENDTTSTTSDEIKYTSGKLVPPGAFTIHMAKILAVIDEGSQAYIYTVRRGMELYAAKVAKDPVFSRYLNKEYQILAGLKHQNILTIYESIPHGYLMELLPETLHTYTLKNFDFSSLCLPGRDQITTGIYGPPWPNG